MLGKLLSLGKKEKFHLELDDSKIVDKVEAVATQVKQETKQVASEAKQMGEKSQPVIASTVKEIKSEATKVAENLKSETTASKSKKATKKELKKSPAKVTNSSPAIDTSYSEEPFWVKLMYKTSEQRAAEEKSEKGFATEYSISKPQPRRRPGGSLDTFRTMARQTKVKF